MQEKTKSHATQQNIIQAAKKLFIKEGSNTVSMEKIAKAAKVNHSLIYYHFKTKDNLWNAVKQSIVDSANAKQTIIPDTSLDWATFLKELLKRQLHFYQHYPEVKQMITLQRLANKKPSKKISQSAQLWIEAIQHYQQQGDINPTLSPAHITCFIVSIVSSMALDHHPIVPDKHATIDYLDSCYAIIYQGLK